MSEKETVDFFFFLNSVVSEFFLSSGFFFLQITQVHFQDFPTVVSLIQSKCDCEV